MRRTLAAIVAVVALPSAVTFALGIADSPSPELAGKTAVHLYSVPGVIQGGNISTFFCAPRPTRHHSRSPSRFFKISDEHHVTTRSPNL